MERGDQEWMDLARAFRALTDGDPGPYHSLPEKLKQTRVGFLCGEYLATRDRELLEWAGQHLTGKKAWRGDLL